MNVSLTPELEQVISSKVKNGFYTSASEVVREALRLLQQRDETQEAKLSALRIEIQKGISELEAGHYRNGDEVMSDIGERLKLLKRNNG